MGTELGNLEHLSLRSVGPPVMISEAHLCQNLQSLCCAFPECTGTGLHTCSAEHGCACEHFPPKRCLITEHLCYSKHSVPKRLRVSWQRRGGTKTIADMKGGDAQGRTMEQEVTANFQEAAEAEPGWAAFTRLNSNDYSFL